MTRRPVEALALALLDLAIGSALLAAALAHAAHRMVLAAFAVYATVLLLFKARDVGPRLRQFVAAARASSNRLLLGPSWVRVARLVVGYDTWSRTERFGLIVIAVVVCALFGWDDGGPFAAALFVAVGAVDLVLALVALAVS